MLLVNEVFDSINGEVNTWGATPATFIRFSGCNLACSYCDTKGHMKVNRAFDTVYGLLDHYQALTPLQSVVTLTGGEPLMQPEIYELLEVLLKKEGKKVVVETNGTINPFDLGLNVPYHKNLCWVFDYKLDQEDKMSPVIHDMRHMRANCWFKFLVWDQESFYRALEKAEDLKNMGGSHLKAWERPTKVAFSPVHGKLIPSDLGRWLINEGAEIVLNLQLHKIIGLR